MESAQRSRPGKQAAAARYTTTLLPWPGVQSANVEGSNHRTLWEKDRKPTEPDCAGNAPLQSHTACKATLRRPAARLPENADSGSSRSDPAARSHNRSAPYPAKTEDAD